MALKIIATGDGSSSLYNEELDEHYHSVHGSVQEAQHVFIDMGLKEMKKDAVSIFEMGFGTGLNFMMTRMANEECKKKIQYTAVETVPLEASLIKQLQYLDIMKRPDLQPVFDAIHQVPWGSYQTIDEQFQLQKLEIDIFDYESNQPFDLIYFDAFGPRVQPDLWTAPIFEKMFHQLTPGGKLVTYCAKGVVRRTMQAVGFEVERLPGPPGKREMLRATRPL